MTETAKKSLLGQILPLVIGALVIPGAIVGVYAIIGRFHWNVITGSLLGALAALANQLILIISVSRAFDKAVKARGEEEMTEEQIAEFTAKANRDMNNSIKLSYAVRLPLLALIILGAALLKPAFDLLALAIAVVAMQFLIMALGFVSNKKKKS